MDTKNHRINGKYVFQTEDCKPLTFDFDNNCYDDYNDVSLNKDLYSNSDYNNLRRLMFLNEELFGNKHILDECPLEIRDSKFQEFISLKNKYIKK